MKKLLYVLLIAGLMVPLAACSVEQTEEGDLPDVEVEGGNLPEYDVDAAQVQVETEEKTVEVPTGIDVTPPAEGDQPAVVEEDPPN